MKRKTDFLIYLILSVSVLCSCEKPDTEDVAPQALPAPFLYIEEQDGSSFTVSWKTVENASGYTYRFEEEIRSIQDTSVHFDGLTSGTYTLQVRSNASRNSKEWANSEFAGIQITLGKDSIEISVDNIQWNSATVTCRPNYGGTYIYEYTTKEYFDRFETAEDVITDYLYTLMYNGISLSSIMKMGEDSREISNLFGNTEYVVFAVGVDPEGNMTTDMVTYGFTTAEMPPVDSEMQKWFGSWTATSAKTLTWVKEDNTVRSELVDRPMTFDISIYGDPSNYQQALIEGWSHCTDYTALAVLGTDNCLEVLAGIENDFADERGYVPTWGGWSRIVNEETGSERFSLVKGQYPAYVLKMDGDKAVTYAMFENVMNTGERFEVVALEVFAIAENGYTVYTDEDKNIPDMPAGEISLEKKEGASVGAFTYGIINGI